MRKQLTVSIVLVLLSNLVGIIEIKANETIPGIYIERLVDRSRAIVPGLKAQYKICADQRLLYKKLFEQGGVAWEAVNQSLPKGYNAKALPVNEPDWDKMNVGKQLEEEYFYGDKYALYQYTKRYEISDRERCALIEHEDLKISVDNGKDHYVVTLKDKRNVQAVPGVSDTPLSLQYVSNKVSHMQSANITEQTNQEALDDIGKDEKIARLLSLLYADTYSNRLPGVGISINKDADDKLKEVIGYEESMASKVTVPRANDEHFIAGQPCDIISAKNMQSRLWYWGKMHYYPGIIERPILLKTESIKKNNVAVGTKEAIGFSVEKKIDNAVFELDSSLR